jgi:ubiquinone/menaquinone biosynthesis C-methylase UbiE
VTITPQREPWHLSGDAAELYERYPVRYILGPWASALVARAGLKHGESVLDVACGTGVIARLAAEAVAPTGRVTGLDLNAGMLAVARSLPAPRGAPITWIEGSAAAMKLPNAAFDVVFCQQGLQFFPDRLTALREMRRVLIPSGRALLSVWTGMNVYHAAVTEALSQHVGAEVAARVAASRVVPDADELRGLVLGAGFRDVAIEACRMNIQLPAVDRFVLLHLAATPVAGAVSALSADTRAAIAEHVRGALRAYADGEGVTVPDQSNVVTALA